MKISKLIEKLTEAKDAYGDHEVTTFSGPITYFKATPAKDGIVHPLKEGEQNEIGIEIQ